MKYNNILMLTYHFWKSERRGGFHYFAEEFCKMGYNVDFVLFPYSLFRVFTHRNKDRFNIRRLFELVKGKQYQCYDNILRNFGFPSLVFPPKWDKFKFNYLTLTSLYISFFIILLKLRRKYEFIVVESTLAIVLIDFIKRLYPTTKIIYRQSDPMHFVHSSRYFINFEENIILKSDLTLFVNKKIKNYTLKSINLSLVNNKTEILANGIDLIFLSKIHEKPSVYNIYEVNALYLGVFPIDWKLIFYIADKLKHIHFIIIIPSNIDKITEEKINGFSNITFINGINPQQVPAFIQYSSIGIIPYAKKEKIMELMGMHSKIYKFMYCKKPIVTYNICLEIEEQRGIFQSFSEEEFLSNVKAASKLKNIKYDFNFEEVNWENLAKKFIYNLSCLK